MCENDESVRWFCKIDLTHFINVNKEKVSSMAKESFYYISMYKSEVINFCKA